MVNFDGSIEDYLKLCAHAGHAPDFSDPDPDPGYFERMRASREFWGVEYEYDEDEGFR